jgi:Peptidase family M23
VPLVPVTHQSWLFSPPLELPLQLRLENGRFDSLRRRQLPSAPPCTTTQVIPADDPSNPTGRDVQFSNGLHQAVDLASAAGNCVYAAYSGRVVKVEIQPGGDTANVSIDHHPRGLGFVTNYNHITEVQVTEGDFVREGEPIAQVSAVPETPTLHFELRAVIDRKGPDGDAAFGDSDMLPIDPTRALYAWERRLVADEPLAGPQIPIAVGITRLHSIHFSSRGSRRRSPCTCPCTSRCPRTNGSWSSCSARRAVAATPWSSPSATRRSGESTWQPRQSSHSGWADDGPPGPASLESPHGDRVGRRWL